MATKNALQIEMKAYDSILPYNLVLVYQKKGVFKDMIEEVSKEFQELTPLNQEFTSKQVVSFVFNDDSPNIFLFLTDNFTFDILVHECTHVVFAIFNIIGSNINEETEEWFAYMNEFMFREIYNMVTTSFKLKIKMNVD